MPRPTTGRRSSPPWWLFCADSSPTQGRRRPRRPDLCPDRVIVRELLEQPDFLVVWSRVWERRRPASWPTWLVRSAPGPGSWSGATVPCSCRSISGASRLIALSSAAIRSWCWRMRSAACRPAGCPSMGCSSMRPMTGSRPSGAMAGSGRLAVPRPERHRLRGLPACTGAARQADRRFVVRRQPWVPWGLCLVCRSLEGRARDRRRPVQATVNFIARDSGDTRSISFTARSSPRMAPGSRLS